MSTSRLLSLLTLTLALVAPAFSRHVHRPLRHNHKHVRQAVSTTSAMQDSLSESEEAVAQDTIEVEEGLTQLPGDVLEFLEAAGQELQQDGDILSSLLNPSAAPGQITVAPIMPVSVLTTQAEYAPSAYGSPSLALPVPLATSSSDSAAPSFIMTRTLRRTSTITSTSLVLETYAYPTFTPSGMYPLNGTVTLQTPPTGTIGTGPYPPDQPANTTSASPTPLAVSDAFNASSSSNVAVYYGQGPNVQTGDLLALCVNPNVDIVILAFVNSFFTWGGFPSANFGPGCTTSTPAQQLHAPGLPSCPSLATDIAACQSQGKKVLVSLGGYGNNVSISTPSAAIQLATDLFSLFGAGTSLDPALRPFGSVILDGFDLDNESGDPTNWDVLASALRTEYAKDTSRAYYLSAAPQCPRPDASIPLAAMTLADFVYVQFYNNPSCNLDADGFQDSFLGWAADIASVNNGTRLFVGAAAWEGAGSGYVVGSGLETRISLVRELGVENFGGVMLWSGNEALDNVDVYGDDYLVYAKASLE